MLGSITPLGERRRNNQWALTTGFYLAGSVLGATALGAVAGLAGWAGFLIARPAPVGVLTAVLVLLLATLGMDLGVFKAAVPTVHRQVDRSWLDRYRGWVYGLGFGFQLGLGVTTIVTTASVYLVVAMAMLSASPLRGALIGAAFGLARGAPLLTTRRVTTPERLRALHVGTEAWTQRVSAISTATIGLMAATVAAMMWRG